MSGLVQVGLCHTTGPAARLIQSVTLSHWNHIIIRIHPTLCVSAAPGGVRVRRITAFPETVWSDLELTPHQETRALGFTLMQVGKPYNWADDILIGAGIILRRQSPQWVTRKLASRRTWQCAQLADAALNAAGVPIFHDYRPNGAVYPASFEPLFRDAGWLKDTDPS